MSEDVELDHRKDWEGRVESWAQATEINAISREAEEARSTLGLIARSLRKVDKIPQFPLAKATNVQGSVRARLLGGTSGLNSTLSKFRNRSAKCPWHNCKREEDVTHFLLECEMRE